MIEQGLTRLKADRHAGAVNLGQDIAGEPELDVGILRAVQARAGGRTAHQLLERLFGPVIAAQAQEFRCIEAVAQFRRKHADGAGIARLAAGGEREQRRLRAQGARRPVSLGIDRPQRAEHRPAQGLRQDRAQPVLAMLERVAAVSGEGFVRAVARKRDGHRLTRQLAHPPGWQGRGIGERFVEHRRQRIDMVEIIGRDIARAVIGGELAGHLRGVIALIQRGDIEPDGTGLDRIAADLRHQRNHAGAVHPARQERPQRHVRDHAGRYRLPQQVEQFRFQIGGAARAAIRERDVPPLAGRGQRRAVAQQQRMPGGQLVDALQDRAVIGDIAPGEVILHRQRIEFAPQQGVCGQALQFRGERNAAVAQWGIEQRLHAHPVARQE